MTTDTAQAAAGTADPAVPVAADGWLQLTRAGAVPTVRPLPSIGRILLQVGAAAAVVLVLVGFVGAAISRRTAESQSVHEVAELTNSLADTVISPALTDAMVTSPAAARAGLDPLIRKRVLSADLVRVKLWTPTGEIIYSDESRLDGMQFTLDQPERDALTDPQTRAEVSDLSQPENRFERGHGTLLEVYRPVWTPSGHQLLFETYFRYGVVSDRASQLWRGFAGITLSSIGAVVLLLVPVMVGLLRRARRAHRQREELFERAMDASLDERRRIAATLHDGVVQELAAASFVVAAAAEDAAARGEPDLAARLREAGTTVRTGIGGMRSLLVDIYPPSLQSAGLASALSDLVGGISSREPRIVLDVETEATARLTPEQQQACFRITQEALRNAVRHADATTVTITLTAIRDAVVVRVSDDGKGFDATESSPEGHFGTRLMVEVARSIGAELAVRSRPAEGTTWRLTVPVR